MNKFHYRIIGIDPSSETICRDYPITSSANKKKLLDILEINEDVTEVKKPEHMTLMLSKAIYRKRKVKIKEIDYRFFKSSIREFFISDDKLKDVYSIIEPDVIMIKKDNLIWKLSIAKTIEEEYYS